MLYYFLNAADTSVLKHNLYSMRVSGAVSQYSCYYPFGQAAGRLVLFQHYPDARAYLYIAAILTVHGKAPLYLIAYYTTKNRQVSYAPCRFALFLADHLSCASSPTAAMTDVSDKIIAAFCVVKVLLI